MQKSLKYRREILWLLYGGIWPPCPKSQNRPCTWSLKSKNNQLNSVHGPLKTGSPKSRSAHQFVFTDWATGLIYTGCADTNASKWNLLLWMGVSTLNASNMKWIAFKFACSRLVRIGPQLTWQASSTTWGRIGKDLWLLTPLLLSSLTKTGQVGKFALYLSVCFFPLW